MTGISLGRGVKDRLREFGYMEREGAALHTLPIH